MVWLSPHISSDRFPTGVPKTIDEKILVFEDRVLGWQIEPAEQLICSSGHAGFAVIHILASYFEMVGMALRGRRPVSPPRAKKKRRKKKQRQRVRRDSREYFDAGVRDVFPTIASWKQRHVRWFVSALWGDVRCKMYHEGMTGPGVFLSANYADPYVFEDLGPGQHP